MSEPFYDLLFQGECLPGADPQHVQRDLGQLLKLDAERLQQMFSGRTVVVRRAVDRDSAARFQQAFKQAGARLRVVPLAAAPLTAAPGIAPGEAAPPAPSPARKPSLAERLAAQSAREAPAGTIQADGTVTWQSTRRPARVPAPGSVAEVAADATLRLAPLGADLLTAQERAEAAAAPVEVDVSHLAVAPSVGNLPTLPRAGAEISPPDVPDLTVSPAGAELGPHREFVELELDLSHLSLAPPGARVGPVRQEIVAEIDLSGLSLAPSGASLSGTV